jgi:hypothetical protein
LVPPFRDYGSDKIGTNNLDQDIKLQSVAKEDGDGEHDENALGRSEMKLMVMSIIHDDICVMWLMIIYMSGGRFKVMQLFISSPYFR